MCRARRGKIVPLRGTLFLEKFTQNLCKFLFLSYMSCIIDLGEDDVSTAS